MTAITYTPDPAAAAHAETLAKQRRLAERACALIQQITSRAAGSHFRYFGCDPARPELALRYGQISVFSFRGGNRTEEGVQFCRIEKERGTDHYTLAGIEYYGPFTPMAKVEEFLGIVCQPSFFDTLEKSVDYAVRHHLAKTAPLDLSALESRLSAAGL